MVLRDEAISRGGVRARMQFAYRRGGETVYVYRRYPNGLSAGQFDGLAGEAAARRLDVFRSVTPDVFATGTVRHPDHATICSWLAPGRDEHRAERECDAARRVPRLIGGGRQSGARL